MGHQAPSWGLEKQVAACYNSLPISDFCIATYVWIDAVGGLRCKSRTLPKVPESLKGYPTWNFDGSSTDQAEGSNSDCYLVPVAEFKDPFRRGNARLIMCAVYDHKMNPVTSNHRETCAAAMTQVENPEGANDEVWFGLEQEYTLLDLDGYPFGWPKGGFPPPQGPYYCSVGVYKVYGREVVEAHYRACLYAGLKISGTNAEVIPAQWGFQLGPGGTLRNRNASVQLRDFQLTDRFQAIETARVFMQIS